MRNMIVVKVERCLGCKSCELACAVEHSRSKNLQEAMTENPSPVARLKVARGTSYSIPLQCLQCEDAPCIQICPSKALRRPDPNSPIGIDQELCIGCKCCLLACPFGVIRLDRQGRSIIKCDQCLERVGRGERPACVLACPTGALEFRSLEEVLAEKREAYLVQIERSLSGAQE